MVARTVGDADKLCTAAIEVARHTYGESGCKHYTFARDVHDPLVVRVAEQWENEELLKRHMRAPHLQQFVSTLNALNLASTSATMFDGTNERDPMDLMKEIAQ
jgi:quinol monooxygenase YgiN